MSKYQAINVGDKAELSHTITQQDIEHFVELTGDDNKLHIDARYAESTIFKKPVAHGMLGASFISTVIGTKLPGDGALWFAQSLEFLLPVRVGDTITVTAEVLQKYDRDSIVELKTVIYNQHKQVVTSGVAKVKVIEPEPAPKPNENPTPAKVALIIGATGGIGREVCRQMADDGYDLAIHFHTQEKAAADLKLRFMTGKRKCVVCKADIGSEEQVAEMIQQVKRQLGTITVLVNCATAKISDLKLPSLTWDDLQSHLDVLVKGMFHLVKSVVPIFEAQKYGKIIAFTTQAIETPSAGWSPYITAKSALHGFCKTMAVELAPKGITVNLISPGMTDTEHIMDIPEKSRLMAAARAPLRRIARPEDIAGAVSFLASAKADYITGETIRINGGQVML